MRCSAEHIAGSYFSCDISAIREIFQIARERRGVAGNINHTLGLHLRDGLNKLLTASLPRRVENHNIRRYALLSELLCRCRRVGTDKARVLHTVAFGVELRVTHSVGNDFNTNQ